MDEKIKKKEDDGLKKEDEGKTRKIKKNMTASTIPIIIIIMIINQIKV